VAGLTPRGRHTAPAALDRLVAREQRLRVGCRACRKTDPRRRLEQVGEADRRADGVTVRVAVRDEDRIAGLRDLLTEDELVHGRSCGTVDMFLSLGELTALACCPSTWSRGVDRDAPVWLARDRMERVGCLDENGLAAG
jgi:hypothetical protein